MSDQTKQTKPEATSTQKDDAAKTATLPEEPAAQHEQSHDTDQAVDTQASSADPLPQDGKKTPKAAQEASDNLIQLPPRKDPEEQRKKRKRIWKIILLCAIALVVVMVLLVILFPDVFNFDAVKRYFHYLGKRDRESYGNLQFDASGTNDYGTFGDCFILGSDGGLYLFDLNGSQKLMIQGTVSDPRVLAGDDRTLCYAMSGSFFAVANKNGDRLLDTTLSGTILDMDLSDDGYICYNLAGSEDKTNCTVLNRDGTAIFRYRSSSQFLSLCAVSPKGKRIAVSGLSENNSTFSNSILIMRTDQEIVAGSESTANAITRLETGNRLIYDLCFVSDDRICALTENSLIFINTSGEIISEFSFDENILSSYSFGGKGFVSLLLRDSLGDGYRLYSFDKNGTELGEAELHDPVRSLDAKGRYLAVLTDQKLTVYRSNMRQYAEISNNESATRVLQRDDGTALLVYSDTTKLVFP